MTKFKSAFYADIEFSLWKWKYFLSMSHQKALICFGPVDLTTIFFIPIFWLYNWFHCTLWDSPMQKFKKKIFQFSVMMKEIYLKKSRTTIIDRLRLSCWIIAYCCYRQLYNEYIFHIFDLALIFRVSSEWAVDREQNPTPLHFHARLWPIQRNSFSLNEQRCTSLNVNSPALVSKTIRDRLLHLLCSSWRRS